MIDRPDRDIGAGRHCQGSSDGEDERSLPFRSRRRCILHLRSGPPCASAKTSWSAIRTSSVSMTWLMGRYGVKLGGREHEHDDRICVWQIYCWAPSQFNCIAGAGTKSPSLCAQPPVNKIGGCDLLVAVGCIPNTADIGLETLAFHDQHSAGFQRSLAFCSGGGAPSRGRHPRDRRAAV